MNSGHRRNSLIALVSLPPGDGTARRVKTPRLPFKYDVQILSVDFVLT